VVGRHFGGFLRIYQTEFNQLLGMQARGHQESHQQKKSYGFG